MLCCCRCEVIETARRTRSDRPGAVKRFAAPIHFDTKGVSMGCRETVLATRQRERNYSAERMAQ
jgi:hypothetical protein